MSRYMTDAQLAELGFADSATAAQAAADADDLYTFVAGKPAATDTDVGQYAIAQWSADADARKTNALRVLALQGRLIDIEA